MDIVGAGDPSGGSPIEDDHQREIWPMEERCFNEIKFSFLEQIRTLGLDSDTMRKKRKKMLCIYIDRKAPERKR